MAARAENAPKLSSDESGADLREITQLGGMCWTAGMDHSYWRNDATDVGTQHNENLTSDSSFRMMRPRRLIHVRRLEHSCLLLWNAFIGIFLSPPAIGFQGTGN